MEKNIVQTAHDFLKATKNIICHYLRDQIPYSVKAIGGLLGGGIGVANRMDNSNSNSSNSNMVRDLYQRRQLQQRKEEGSGNG